MTAVEKTVEDMIDEQEAILVDSVDTEGFAMGNDGVN